MAKDDKDIEGEEGGGGGKKKLIIIIAAVVLLLGGGAAAFFLMGGEDKPADETAAKAEETAKAKPPEEGDPVYLDLKPKFIVNLPPGGPAKMLQIALTVYTRQQAVADFIKDNDPMFRNDLLNLFESQSSKELLTVEGKKKLQQAVQDLISKKLDEMDQTGKIKAVYFTEFVLQ